jgi:hypothetical protein
MFRASKLISALVVLSLARCGGVISPDVAETGTDASVPHDGRDAPVMPTRWKQIVLGTFLNCGLTSENLVFCWGKTRTGDLGRTQADTQVPTRVPIGAVQSLAVSFGSACAVMDEGSVLCWGSNLSGEMGRGSPGVERSDQWYAPGPVPISDAVAITAGGGWGTFCATLRNRSVTCWGRNRMGETGQPAAIRCGVSQCQPNSVALAPFAPSVTAVRNQGTSTCAILADQTMRCWGGTAPSLGAGPLPERCPDGDVCAYSTPQRVLIDNVVSMRSNDPGWCVINGSAELYCWGPNGFPQDIEAIPASRHTPTRIEVPGPVTDAVASERLICVRLRDQSWWCAGRDPFSAPIPGQPTARTFRREPRLDRFISISAQYPNMCGVDADGAGWCWGNSYLPIPGHQLDQWVSEPTRVPEPVE